MLWAPETSTPLPCSSVPPLPPQGGQCLGSAAEHHAAGHKSFEGQCLFSIHHPTAQIKETTKSIVMLNEQKEAGRQNYARIKNSVSVILKSTKHHLWCYPCTEGGRQQGERTGAAEGVTGNNVSGTQARRQVSTATGKRRRLPMCLCFLHPTTLHHHHPSTPSTADEHM